MNIAAESESNKNALKPAVVIVGVRSQIGHYLLKELCKDSEHRIVAVTRARTGDNAKGILWLTLEELFEVAATRCATYSGITVVHLAPIAVLPSILGRIASLNPRRVIAFSSTSAVTKAKSRDVLEQVFVEELITAEETVKQYCERKGIGWTIFRPTLVYSWGRDRNVSEIGAFIRRFKWFPIFGDAQGLRQPVHAEDLAKACKAVMDSVHTCGKTYTLAGARVLTYRDMVAEVFQRLGIPPRFVRLPLGVLRISIQCARLFPRFRNLSPELATRMAQDMNFSYAEAERDFGFRPRPFQLAPGSE